RVVTDVRFINGNWFPAAGGGGVGAVASTISVPFAPGSIPRDRTVANGGIGTAEHLVRATITIQADATGGTGYVPFPGDADSMGASGFAQGDVAAVGFGTVLLTVA